MKSDADIKRDVEAELQWNPEIDQTDIAIKVNAGVVALSGFVHTFYEKHLAERAVKRISGVKAVANDIEVRLIHAASLTDPEIAREALASLQRELGSAADTITPAVEHGYVTLEGSVAWHYQRERAASTVARIKGVKAVTNTLQVLPTIATDDIKQKIEAAFRRSAEIDASHVSVAATGSEVVLRGEVRSWAERDQAQATAWSAPGVTQVRNEISIRT